MKIEYLNRWNKIKKVTNHIVIFKLYIHIENRIYSQYTEIGIVIMNFEFGIKFDKVF